MGDADDTARLYPRGGSMHALVERHADRRPDAEAVVHGDAVLTYRGLDDRAQWWADRLHASGVRAEDRVGVRLPRGVELVAVLLGVLKAGAAYLPLDPDYPQARLDFMVRDSGMSALVTDGAPSEVPPGTAVLRPAPSARRPGRRSRRPIHEAQAAYVLYTSGSTGRPKGIVITHANATDLLHWTHETFGASLDRVLATTSICFDCSILEIFGPLTAGGTVVLADDALAVGRVETGHGVRLVHSVPSVMAELMRTDRLPPSVDTVLLGGEPPWPQLVDDIYAPGAVRRVLNLYGPAECTSYATMATIEPGSASPPPIGRAVANTWITRLGDDGGPVPDDQPAEIHIGGRGVARGYLERPALTAERFLPDPVDPGARSYRTGDLARRDPATGVLTYLGRLDDQVKVRGVRVEPGEVERVLLAQPGVGEAAVTAPLDGESRVRLTGFVVPSGSAEVSASELRDRLAAILPAALVPDTLVVLDRMPRMPNGKLDRAQLVAPQPDRPTPTAGDRSRDDLEATLCRIWAEAFELEHVGIHDDFYDLGGHSLAAVRIRGRIADHLGVDVPLPVVLHRRTIAALADRIRRGEAADAETTDAAPVGPVVPRYRPPSAGPARLSPNQRAVLDRAWRPYHDPTLHLPLCVRLTGDIHPAALADAVTELVRRHDVLRTAVGPTCGDPGAAVVAEPAPVALPMVDLSGLPAARRHETAVGLATASARAPFDLATAPLLHPLLLRFAADDHVVSVTLHQLASDVWSMAGVGRQLIELYASATAAEPPDARVPLVQYPDWADAQLRWLDTATASQVAFWRDRLAGLPALELPGSARRGPAADARTATRDFGLPGELVERLDALGREESATLYVVVAAAYQVLIGRWAGQSRFTVGCPTTGRVHPDLARTIGPLLDAVVLRADLTGRPTFRDVVRRTRDEAWTAYAHEDLPFAEFVRALDADSDPTRHPVFQTSVVIHYLTDPVPPPPGVGLDDFGDRPGPHTSLDAELALFVDGGGAMCALSHREDVVDAAEAERLAVAFPALLRELVAEPDVELGCGGDEALLTG